MKTFKEIDKNIEYINRKLKNSPDITKREFLAAKSTKALLVYVDGLTDQNLLQDSVIESLTQNILVSNIAPSLNRLLENITSPTYELVDDFDKIMLSILSGDTAFFIDGLGEAVVISSRGFNGRGVPEVQTEGTVLGSKEAFAESLRTNTMLIRRRIRNTSLILEQMNLGTKTKTDIGIMYMEGAVVESVLSEIKASLNRFPGEAVLDIGYIEKFLKKEKKSPFPTAQITERPDKAAASLLEGRVVIICDNSPFVLIAPVVFASFFQASEDFYGESTYMFLSRILRFLAFFIAIATPALYISVVLYNPNIIPASLIFRMEEARREVPFSIFIEFLLMDTAFELLKEAGVRLPHALGSSIGVVGGIIIGQAAIEAGLASPIVVIIVALVAVCTFTIPSPQLSFAVRICKYLLLICSLFLGLFGFWLGVILIVTHMVSIENFGYPYIYIKKITKKLDIFPK